MQLVYKIMDEGVKAALAEVQARTKNMTPAMKIVGQIVRASVVRNFEVGGRPVRWKPSRKKGKKSGTMTLIESHRLINSISAKGYPDRAEIGTNVIYAAIHHLGGTIHRRESILAFKNKGGFLSRKAAAKRKTSVNVTVARAHETEIPARPFLMVQREDWPAIAAAVNDYLLQRLNR